MSKCSQNDRKRKAVDSLLTKRLSSGNKYSSYELRIADKLPQIHNQLQLFDVRHEPIILAGVN